MTLVRILGRPLAVRDDFFRNARPGAAIVVLGSKLGADGGISAAGEERVRAGIAAWRAGAAPILCFSGGHSHGEPIPEADAMAARARALGVPAKALLVEIRSRSTYENAHYCAEVLLPAHREVWVVTQPFHSRRAVRHFRRAGFTARAWPIEDSLQFRDPGWGLRRVWREYVSWLKTLTMHP